MKTLLIFDNDASILEAITIIFEENGYKVEVSETSHNIIQKVSDCLPDIILMDHQIPNIGGIKAIKLLKNHKEFKNIPVIYISADNSIAVLAKKAQADDYVSKPFDLDNLENKVSNMLNGI